MDVGNMHIYFISLRPFLFETCQKRKGEKPECVYSENDSKERKPGWLHSGHLPGRVM